MKVKHAIFLLALAVGIIFPPSAAFLEEDEIRSDEEELEDLQGTEENPGLSQDEGHRVLRRKKGKQLKMLRYKNQKSKQCVCTAQRTGAAPLILCPCRDNRALRVDYIRTTRQLRVLNMGPNRCVVAGGDSILYVNTCLGSDRYQEWIGVPVKGTSAQWVIHHPETGLNIDDSGGTDVWLENDDLFPPHPSSTIFLGLGKNFFAA